MAAGTVSLRKSHDIVILSFCDIVKGQANYQNPIIRFWAPYPTDDDGKSWVFMHW